MHDRDVVIVSETPTPLTTDPSSVESLVDRWLTRRSDATRDSYSKDLHYFAQWLRAKTSADAARSLIGGGHSCANRLVHAYVTHLVDRGLAPATINRRLAALKSLVKAARLSGMVDWTIDVEGEQVQRYRDTAGPGIRAIQDMLAVAVAAGGIKALRDTAILMLLFALGLRRNEITTCDVEHFDRSGKRLSILGKGKAQRVWITVPNSATQVLCAYLDARGARPGEPLIKNVDPAKKGVQRRLSSGGLYRVVRRLAEKAGIPGIVSPHRIRHSAITAALDATGGNVREARHFSRHSRVDTLLVYDDARVDHAGRIADLLALELDVVQNSQESP